MTSADRGEAPEPMKRTRPPTFALILLKTSLSQIGDGFFPEAVMSGSYINPFEEKM